MEQTLAVQVRAPQHWAEEVQPPPAVRQAPPPHTPLEQVNVPQHSEEDVQRVPEPWQEPPEQTFLALHRSVPQQSAEVEQRCLLVWQDPVAPSSMTGSASLGWLQAVQATVPARRRRLNARRMGGV